MGSMKMFANQFSTDFILASCSPSQSFAFGFNASYVRIQNLAAVPIRFNLTSTGPASTDDALILPSKEIAIYEIPIYGGSVMTTSTTTSTDDTGHLVSVSAWGA